MKKKIVTVICVILLVATVFTALLFSAVQRGFGFSVARCLVAENGSYMMIKENSPIVMHNTKDNEKLFNNIDTGDRIWVVHDGINESYPGSTGVYAVIKLGEGEVSDIPEEVLESLSEHGWIVLVSEGEVRN